MRHSAGISAFIGDTPLAPVTRMFPAGSGPAVYLKLEQFNPGGSVKDRTALGMLSWEERHGRLRPGMTIVESSSGNTAIGLAVLAQERGYRVVSVCDRHLPAVKRARLRAFGADIVFLPDTPPGLDTVRLRIEVARRLAEGVDGAITLGQYSHPGNPDVHQRTTGPEIWQALEGDVSAVVVAVGTCGTITGIGRHARASGSGARVIGVEPVGSVVFGGAPGRYLVQGGGLDFVPSILDPSVVDAGLKITDAEALEAVQWTSRQQGWLIGGTGGLVVAGIRKVAKSLGPGDTIVGVIADGGDRYVDSLLDEAWIRSSGMGQPASEEPEAREVAALAREIGCAMNRVPEDPGPSTQEMLDRLERVGAA